MKDLIEARELYHVHLAHLTTVYATAIGLYRIRRNDKDAQQPIRGAEAAEQRGTLGPRTLANSVVRRWSWPCVLVFVEKWLTPEQLAAAKGAVVPPFLYLPDGRVVPVCTIEAGPFTGTRLPEAGHRFSSHRIGGGFPLVSRVQGTDHLGSVGCLLTDGAKYFALTSQHVAGEPGRKIYSLLDEEPFDVGVGAEQSLKRLPFAGMFPGFAGENTVCNLDAGLVEIKEIDRWTAQILGLGTLAPVVCFDVATASLDWIGRRLLAYGAASGRMAGEVAALFYRYRSQAGRDAVTDFLISGRAGAALPTQPGDSGTVWCLDPAEYGETDGSPTARYRPLALQWGGVRLSTPGGHQQFTLASSLAVICRELDMDLVSDLNAELPQYWGATGHYKVAQMAVDRVRSTALRAFLRKHLERISYSAQTIASGIQGEDPRKFVPLADVPDYVWKTNINRRKPAVARSQENWNHYADIDLPLKNGKTLNDLCGPDITLSRDAWLQFYKDAPHPKNDDSQAKHVNNGSLPFRVWQVFDELVRFRREGKQAEFLAAAGVLAHYIGDACQPLHGSMHADGLFGSQTGVHGAYEEEMIDLFAADIGKALDAFDDTTLIKPKLTHIGSGYDAGRACIELMRRAQTYLPPTRICKTYDQLGGGTSKAMLKDLWKALGGDTVRCLADGYRTLAMLWDAAYAKVKAHPFTKDISETELMKIYESKSFLTSQHLGNAPGSLFVTPD
jgi:hypothetical protein